MHPEDSLELGAKKAQVRMIGDPLERVVVDAMRNLDIADTIARIEAELTRMVAAYASPREVANGRVERSGQSAASFIEAAILAWSSTIRSEPMWSRAKWLYVLRRVRIAPLSILQFGDDIALMRHRDSMSIGVTRLLTIQSGTSPKFHGHVKVTNEGISYSVNQSEAHSFARRVIRTQHLWLLHNTARIVGKGFDLSFALGDLPHAVTNSDYDAAMALYDHRTRGMASEGLVGTVLWRQSVQHSDSTLALCRYVDEGADSQQVPPQLVRQLVPTASLDFLYEIHPTCEVSIVDIAPFASLNRDIPRGQPDWFQKELPSILALLHVICQDQTELHKFQLARVGYLRMEERELLETLRRPQIKEFLRLVLPVDSDEEQWSPGNLLRALQSVEGKLWPTLDGPVVRQAPDGSLMVDAVTATQRLMWLLTVGRDGGGYLPNLRAGHFELSVRNAIDHACRGAPQGSELRRLVGRHLKLGKTTVTDIDAIALHPDGTLILIDAKSYPYTLDYAAGRYGAVSNLTSKLLKDAKQWKAKVQTLKTNPEGANYHFPKGSRIVPLIVTPFPAYLPTPICAEEVMPGLRLVSSLSELSSFLRDNGSSERLPSGSLP